MRRIIFLRGGEERGRKRSTDVLEVVEGSTWKSARKEKITRWTEGHRSGRGLVKKKKGQRENYRGKSEV